MSLARRMGPAGMRRAGNAAAILPWKGFESGLVLALDAYLGITLGTGVSQWSDQSGSGNHFLQATAGKQPSYSTFNTRPVVRFDGTDDVLQKTGFSGLAADADSTTFIVVKNSAVTGFMFESSKSGPVNDSGYAIFLNTTAWQTRVSQTAVTAWHVYTENTAPNTTDIEIYEITHSNSETKVYLNGTLLGTVTTPSITVAAQDEYTLGERAQTGSNWTGDYCSHLVLDSVLSDGDRSIIRNRLASRWGVTL